MEGCSLDSGKHVWTSINQTREESLPESAVVPLLSSFQLTVCLQMASNWVLQKDLVYFGLLSMDPSIPSVYVRMKFY